MYLVASKERINSALFAKRCEGQIPIYFVSRVSQVAELNYPALEKLMLALVHATRRLRRYFQAHMIMVPTESQSRVTISHRCIGKLQKQFKTAINAKNNPQLGKQGRMEPSQLGVYGLSSIGGFIS
ncbi:putative reverse transcriptase domain, ribonuclease H-like domain protein [Tanacetum coccineum]